jgi:hypothetical protein
LKKEKTSEGLDTCIIPDNADERKIGCRKPGFSQQSFQRGRKPGKGQKYMKGRMS